MLDEKKNLENSLTADVSSVIKDLNTYQKEAVLHTNGPLLILAGAGSGKTKTLVSKVAYLILNGVRPENILAVTFTNKAAKEMKARIQDILEELGLFNVSLPYFGTFHGICVRILKTDGSSIGIPSNFVIYDESDKMQIAKEVFKDRFPDQDIKNIRSILSIVSNIKNGSHKDSESEEKYNPLARVAENFYSHYQQGLQQNSALDFDDLLLKTVELFQKSQEVCNKYKSLFQYILVDEYQDTNMIQYQLLKLVLNSNNNICVVGDDWQSIYKWRGADYRNILNFEKDFSGAKVIKLEENYRSTQNILDTAEAIISKNTSRSSKKLFTNIGKGSKVKISQYSSESHEAEGIITKIRDLKLSDHTASWSDFCVLYRTNAQSRALEEACLFSAIPYQMVGGTKFYDRKEVKDILAYLKLIHQPNDSISFERICNYPARSFGEKSFQTFKKFVNDIGGGSLESAISKISLFTDNLKAQSTLINFFKKIESIKSSDYTVSELIHVVAEKFGIYEDLNDGTQQGIERIENIKELISVAINQNATDLGVFLEDVSLVSDLDSVESGKDGIVLMTLHAAKGLEFPTVFIAGLEEGIFPHSRSIFEEEEIEEERRLAYVGVTRAKENLYVSYATRRTLFGSSQYNQPSRFIKDIIHLPFTESESSLPSYSYNYQESGSFSQSSGSTHSTSSFSNKDIAQVDDPAPSIKLNIGDRVKHPIFGVGWVNSLDDEMATIRFEKGGNKNLHLGYAPLQKI
jgi:DNA helicase-2/ATP-dependent DNA helicase PcrA